ncbi:MAG: shikimate dehydrogenase [Myxococcales bacterium]|nr:shikimate dehydrogenase [Polyangiaceae bacterium]MDW8250614.1 shikimate dehydrogenase [Myxococcales bacterium]
MSVFPLRFAVVGHPIQHSASPAMHMAALRAMGLPHLYEAIDCPTRASFERILGLLKRGYFGGLNVTAPLKGFALELAGASDAETRRIGVANTLWMEGGVVQASNTDVPGMVEQIQQAGVKLGVALILGSGGAARAAVEACTRLGVRVVGVTSRSWINSEVLYESTSAQSFRERRALTFPWPQPNSEEERTKGSIALQIQWGELAAMADLIIQATSAGLSQDNPGELVAHAIPWKKVPPHAVAYELVYGPEPTPFARAAEQRGLRLLDGLDLLARQGARSLEHWLHRPAPLEVMREAARRYIFRR